MSIAAALHPASGDAPLPQSYIAASSALAPTYPISRGRIRSLPRRRPMMILPSGGVGRLAEDVDIH
jgi:hypothetical protein